MLPKRTHSRACLQRSLHTKRETLATTRRDVFGNWGLTLDISGVPRARPLDGLVRALVELKPNGNHRAELMLLDLGFVVQSWTRSNEA